MLPSSPASPFATVAQYVASILKRLDENDKSLTTLQIDDFYYPMVDLDGGDYVDSDTIAELLMKAKHSAFIRSLELRFVEFDPSVSKAFQALLMERRNGWESISVTACSGMTSEDFCALVPALDTCQTLYWHHNNTSCSALGTLGISLASSTSLKALHLTREFLGGDYARALLDGLSANTKLDKLVLNFCRFDTNGVEALADALAQNSQLKELDLGACYLLDAQVETIVSALTGHPTLQTLVLTLNGCHLQGARALAKLLQQPNCPLESLNLSHQNDASSKLYLQPIARALLKNTSLKRLCLSRNRLTAQDVTSLFYALRTNQTLRVLDLNSNDIGDAGVVGIASALADIQGLSELYLLKNDIRSNASAVSFLRALQTFNRTLQILELNPNLLYLDQIRYQLALNAAGRRLLSSPTDHDVPLALWPKVLARSAANKKKKNPHHTAAATTTTSQHSVYHVDALYYMLQGPVLFSQR